MEPSHLRPFPIRRILVMVACVIPFLWLTGQILKDRFLPLNLLFYLPPLLCFFSGSLAFILLRGSSKQLRYATLGVALVALGKGFFIDFQHPPNPTEPVESIRLVHWNISAGRFGSEVVSRYLRDQNPDLVLLSEAPSDVEVRKIARSLFKNGSWFRRDGMAVASRFPIEPGERLDLPDGRAWEVSIKASSSPFDLLAVDLRANLLVERKPDLDFISTWIGSRMSDGPLLAVGDFNTPRDSVHFRGFRKTLRHTYEEAGRGWPYSWPFPFPVIQTDHIWHSKGVTSISHRYDFTFGSDHLPQVYDFRIDPENSF